MIEQNVDLAKLARPIHLGLTATLSAVRALVAGIAPFFRLTYKMDAT